MSLLGKKTLKGFFLIVDLLNFNKFLNKKIRTWLTEDLNQMYYNGVLVEDYIKIPNIIFPDHVRDIFGNKFIIENTSKIEYLYCFWKMNDECNYVYQTETINFENLPVEKYNYIFFLNSDKKLELEQIKKYFILVEINSFKTIHLRILLDVK